MDPFLYFPMELIQNQLDFRNLHQTVDPGKWHQILATTHARAKFGLRNAKNQQKRQCLKACHLWQNCLELVFLHTSLL